MADVGMKQEAKNRLCIPAVAVPRLVTLEIGKHYEFYKYDVFNDRSSKIFMEGVVVADYPHFIRVLVDGSDTTKDINKHDLLIGAVRVIGHPDFRNMWRIAS